MKLTNEFVVAAPVETTWATLLDVPRVARALPGATLEPDATDGSFRGSMKLKLGPVTAEYAGTARLEDVDEDRHSASFYVQGRELRGQGTAAATITSWLTEADGGTRVVLETDLRITGRQAQLGANLIEDVAKALLGQFSQRLERELLGDGAEAPAAGAAAEEPAAEALDVGAAVLGPLRERAALVAVGIAIGLLVGRVVWRRS